MYPYHNKIKQRIRAGELIGAEKREDYPGIGPCVVLRFSTYPPLRPIRPHRYAEYAPILAPYTNILDDESDENNGTATPEYL